MVADKTNILRGTVMECSPRDDPAVLVSTGHWLPLDHQIRIVQRLRILNSNNQVYQFIDTDPNESYIRISMLKLDKSQNGRMDGIVCTSNEKIGKFYNDAIREITSSLSHHNDGTHEHPANDTGRHNNVTLKKKGISDDVCGRKRKLREASSFETSESRSKSNKVKSRK